MHDDRRPVSRRQWLACGTALSLGGLTGCMGFLDSSEGSDSPDESGSSGPLQVSETQRLDDGGRTVRVGVTVENTADEARRATLVVDLSHTEAEGSIDRSRPLLLASGQERTVVLPFRPKFFGEDGTGRPEEGEFRFDPRFENVQVYENYPGLVSPADRTAVAGGNAWPATAYDPRASAHNPGTEAPRSSPTATWTAEVGFAYDATGPVVADGTVYAGRPVRALSVEDGSEQWVHDGPARTGPLAVGDDLVAFGTAEDFRVVESESGEVRWTVSSGDTWEGGATIADGRVYTASDQLYAIDAASGEELWTADTGGALTGPPPVADGVVLAGGNPLRALDAADGTDRWTVSGGEPVAAAAVAYDTAFVLTASQMTALDLSEGRTRWFAPGPFREERIAVGNGAVYAQSDGDYRPVALDAADGQTKWVSDGTDGLLGPPSATDGVLVVNDERGSLYGIDTGTGEVLWTSSVSSSVPGSVAVADGVAYFNEPNGPLHALVAGD